MSLLTITSDGSLTETLLSKRELSVLKLVGEGLKQKEIAGLLGITHETVKKHSKNAYKKLGAHNKIEALRKAALI
jgi:DNA-binding NarL/FixJ family response regulator